MLFALELEILITSQNKSANPEQQEATERYLKQLQCVCHRSIDLLICRYTAYKYDKRIKVLSSLAAFNQQLEVPIGVFIIKLLSDVGFGVAGKIWKHARKHRHGC